MSISLKSINKGILIRSGGVGKKSKNKWGAFIRHVIAGYTLW